jgi:hypothetical protein
MPRFRKKPIVVEAIKCREAMVAFACDQKALPRWLVKGYGKGLVVPSSEGLIIRTLEGSMLARPRDWIVRGVAGELYPCKPDIFCATFESE